MGQGACSFLSSGQGVPVQRDLTQLVIDDTYCANRGSTRVGYDIGIDNIIAKLCAFASNPKR